MAKRIKLQDRSGVQLLPLTRAELVQFTAITGLTLAESAQMSVQAALEALTAKANLIADAEGNHNIAIQALQNKLQGISDEQAAVKTYIDAQDTAYLALAYAEAASKATAAQTNSYAYAETKATEAQTNSYAKAVAEASAAETAAKSYADDLKDLAYAKAEAEGTSAKNYADGKFLSNVKLNSSYLTVQSDDTYGRYVDLGSIATSEGLQSLTSKVEAIEAAYATAASVTALETAYNTGYTALQTRIAANESAIATLNGDAQTTGSVDNKVAAGIASVVASAPADFDTLKEVADWIANDSSGAAAMQNAISTLNGADTVTGSVAKQVKDAYTAMETHTVNGKALSTNPVLDADDITYTGNTTVAGAIEDLYSQIGAGGSVTTQIENAINALDASYTATGTAQHSGTYVMNAVTQVDGAITSIGSVEVEAAGAAAAVKTTIDDYTVNGKKISTSPTLYAGDIATSSSDATTVAARLTSLETADDNSVKTVNGQSPTNGAVTVNANQIDTVNTYKIGSDSSATTHKVDEVLAAAVLYTELSGTYDDTTI